jgi:hypothetical protein
MDSFAGGRKRLILYATVSRRILLGEYNLAGVYAQHLKHWH